jgi:hypothetical protein
MPREVQFGVVLLLKENQSVGDLAHAFPSSYLVPQHFHLLPKSGHFMMAFLTIGHRGGGCS